jgi:hypothetical protein
MLLSSLNGVVNSMKGGILSLLCVTVVTITIIYKTKQKKLLIKRDENETGLDIYSYRDVFRFTINEEFHLAKSFFYKILVYSIKIIVFLFRIQ